jgi:hypothetical protein
MPAENFIDSSERNFLQASLVASYGDLWRSAGFVVEPSTTVYQDASFGSLKLSGASSGSLFYNDWEDPVNDIPSQYAVSGANDLNDEIVSFVWVRATENCTVRMRNIRTVAVWDVPTQTYLLSTNVADRVEGDWGVHVISLGIEDSQKWHLIRARMLAMPKDTETTRYSLGFELEITYSGDVGECFVSRPTITALMDIAENSFFVETIALIPEVFLGQDFLNPLTTNVPFPLLRLIDVMTNRAGEIQDSIYDFEYKNESQGFDPSILETNSFFITPDLITSLPHLSWLAQFRGRELVVTYEPSTEGEEWTKFILDSSTLDGTAVIALSAFTVEGISGGVEAYFKWQVRTGYYGHNAGTIDGMISAIQLLLTGTKFVDYSVGSNEITFLTSIGETYASDTLGLIVGDEHPYVLEILEPTRPLGMIIKHELIA